MLTKSLKAKGRRLQDEVRQDILHRFDLDPDQVRSRIMGEAGTDLVVSHPAWDLAVECKNTERLSIWSAIQQAEANAGAKHIPVVVFRKNHRKPYVTLPWKDFLDIACLGRADGFQGLIRLDVPSIPHALKELRRLAGIGRQLEHDVQVNMAARDARSCKRCGCEQCVCDW